MSVSIKSTRQNKNPTRFGNRRLPAGAPEPCCFALKARSAALHYHFYFETRLVVPLCSTARPSGRGLSLAQRLPRLHGRAANARRLRPGAPALCATSFRSAKTRYNANLGKYSLREYWIGAVFQVHALKSRTIYVKGHSPLTIPA